MAFTTEHEVATVKNAALYNLNGVWYMDIKYLVEDDSRVIEYHIPKVRIPIEHALVLRNIDFNDPRHSSYILELPDRDLIIEETACVPFMTRLIKEKRKEMTLSEIEAILGYKIKIVNEK